MHVCLKVQDVSERRQLQRNLPEMNMIPIYWLIFQIPVSQIFKAGGGTFPFVTKRCRKDWYIEIKTDIYDFVLTKRLAVTEEENMKIIYKLYVNFEMRDLIIKKMGYTGTSILTAVTVTDEEEKRIIFA